MMKKGILSLVIVSFFLAGCAERTSILLKESTIQNGNYESIAKNLKKNEKDNLLWYLDAGIISENAKKYPLSNYFFDKAEVKIKQYNKKVLAGNILASVGGILTNDTFMDYKPKIYEGIMANTYKGINFLRENNIGNARVEFNRALERQRRAKSFFKVEINQEKRKIHAQAEKTATEKNINLSKIQKLSNNQKTKDAIGKIYSNLFAFKPYPDFINPFTSYISGLFFMSVHNYAKAVDLFKETYGMIEGNETAAPYVKSDLKYAIKLASSIRNNSKIHYLWIIFANGKGPSKKELRFDIPLFLITNKVYYAGIALPTLKENLSAYLYLYITDGNDTIDTKQVASMDKIIKTEFKKRFPIIMARAIARTVTQSTIQYELRERNGAMGGLLGAIYQDIMNRADIRQWKLLPKNFQIAKIKLTSPTVSIYTPGHIKLIELNVDQNVNHIVFIRIPERNAKVVYDEVSF